MADLITTPALEAAPLRHGDAVLALVDSGQVTGVAFYPGAVSAVAGMSFPAPGRVSGDGERRLVWAGRDMAFLIGAAPTGVDGAAVTDQSDGWACLSLTGTGAEAVLARLVALDLSAAAFPAGSAARCQLNHMNAVLWREADGFRLMVFRSMARTAWHELSVAMAQVAARATAC